jgi:peptidoglycan/LPS O-acetylase OafA/YrhL
MLVETQSQALSRHNNFDLIRLLAACQVVAMHVGEHMEIAVPGVFTFFPGVPIFFIVSGFLVTASLARCATLGEYFRNRALRIYPALWAMTLVSLILLAALGDLNAGTPRLKLVLYVLGQSTFLQHVAGGLGMFRSFGTGGVNGALWTIATELQFYAWLPLMFWLANHFPRYRVLFLVILLCASLLLYELLLPAFTAPGWDKTSLAWRLIAFVYISLPTHLFGFLIGVLCYLKLPALLRLVRGKFPYWMVAYAIFVAVAWRIVGLAGWNLEKDAVFVLAQRLLLAGLILSVAFSAPGLAHRILRGNDISYGVYIYHMLVINTLLQLGLRGWWPYGMLAAFLTAVAAYCSWRWIEKPALRLKRTVHSPRAAPLLVQRDVGAAESTTPQ